MVRSSPFSLRLGSHCAVGALSLTLLLTAASYTRASQGPDFVHILQAYGDRLNAVGSDAEALALFTSNLGRAVSLKESVALLTRTLSRGRTREAATWRPPDPTNVAVAFVAELAAWQLARMIVETADTKQAAVMQTALEKTAASQRWLLAGDQRQNLSRAVALGKAITEIQLPQSSDADSVPGYDEYSATIGRAYPELRGTDTSWLAVAERDGSAGLRRRLIEAVEDPGRTYADREALAAKYFNARLRPVLSAQVIAFTIMAEAEAERGTRKHWQHLQAWKGRIKEWKGLVRLCGTWQWVVHNHQNHRDHKMMLVFPPPGEPVASASAGPRPAKIIVLGDTVYLRWEFPGGFQEDSLLFTTKGQRLEGTFISSPGAWGSITGKRARPCKSQD